MRPQSVTNLPNDISQTNYIEIITVGVESDIAILGAAPSPKLLANQLAFNKKYRRTPIVASNTPVLAPIAIATPQLASRYSATTPSIEIVRTESLRDLVYNELDPEVSLYTCSSGGGYSLTYITPSKNYRQNELGYRSAKGIVEGLTYEEVTTITPWLTVLSRNASEIYSGKLYIPPNFGCVIDLNTVNGTFFRSSGGYLAQDINVVPGTTYRCTVIIAAPKNITPRFIEFGFEGVVVSNYDQGLVAVDSKSSEYSFILPDYVVYKFNVDAVAPNQNTMRVFFQSYEAVCILDISACVAPPLPPPTPRPTSCNDINAGTTSVNQNGFFSDDLRGWQDKLGNDITEASGYTITEVYDSAKEVLILRSDGGSGRVLPIVQQFIHNTGPEATYIISVGLDETENDDRHENGDKVIAEVLNLSGKVIGSAEIYYWPVLRGNTYVSRKRATFAVNNIYGDRFRLKLTATNDSGANSLLPMRVSFALVCVNAGTNTANVSNSFTTLSPGGCVDVAQYYELYGTESLSRTYENLTPNTYFTLTLRMIDAAEVTVVFDLDGKRRSFTREQRYVANPGYFLDFANSTRAIDDISLDNLKTFKVLVPASGKVKFDISGTTYRRAPLFNYINYIKNSRFYSGTRYWDHYNGQLIYTDDDIDYQPIADDKLNIVNNRLMLRGGDVLKQRMANLTPGAYYYLMFNVKYVNDRNYRLYDAYRFVYQNVPILPNFSGWPVLQDDVLYETAPTFNIDGKRVPDKCSIIDVYAYDSSGDRYKYYYTGDPLSLKPYDALNGPGNSLHVNLYSYNLRQNGDFRQGADILAIFGPVANDGIADLELHVANLNSIFVNYNNEHQLDVTDFRVFPLNTDPSEIGGMPLRITDVKACADSIPLGVGFQGDTLKSVITNNPNALKYCGEDGILLDFNDFTQDYHNWQFPSTESTRAIKPANVDANAVVLPRNLWNFESLNIFNLDAQRMSIDIINGIYASAQFWNNAVGNFGEPFITLIDRWDLGGISRTLWCGKGTTGVFFPFFGFGREYNQGNPWTPWAASCWFNARVSGEVTNDITLNLGFVRIRFNPYPSMTIEYYGSYTDYNGNTTIKTVALPTGSIYAFDWIGVSFDGKKLTIVVAAVGGYDDYDNYVTPSYQYLYNTTLPDYDLDPINFGTSAYPCDGVFFVADVRNYDKALSESELAAIYNNGKGQNIYAQIAASKSQVTKAYGYYNIIKPKFDRYNSANWSWASYNVAGIPTNYDLRLSFDMIDAGGVQLTSWPTPISTDATVGRKTLSIPYNSSIRTDSLANFSLGGGSLVLTPRVNPNLLYTMGENSLLLKQNTGIFIVETIVIYNYDNKKIGTVLREYVGENDPLYQLLPNTVFLGNDETIEATNGIAGRQGRQFGQKRYPSDYGFYKVSEAAASSHNGSVRQINDSKLFDENGSLLKETDPKYTLIGDIIECRDYYGQYYLVKDAQYEFRGVDVKKNYALTVGLLCSQGDEAGHFALGKRTLSNPFYFSYLTMAANDSTAKSLNTDITGFPLVLGAIANHRDLKNNTYKFYTELDLYKASSYDPIGKSTMIPIAANGSIGPGIMSLIMVADNSQRNDPSATTLVNADICLAKLQNWAGWPVDGICPTTPDPIKSSAFQLGTFRPLNQPNGYQVVSDGRVIVKIRMVTGINQFAPKTGRNLNIANGAEDISEAARMVRSLPYVSLCEISEPISEVRITNFAACAVPPADPIATYPSIANIDVGFRWKGTPRRELNIFNMFLRYTIRDVVDYKKKTITHTVPSSQRHSSVQLGDTCDYWKQNAYNGNLQDNVLGTDISVSPTQVGYVGNIKASDVKDISQRLNYLWSVPVVNSKSNQDRLTAQMGIPPAGILEKVEIFYLANKIDSAQLQEVLRPLNNSFRFVDNGDGSQVSGVNGSGIIVNPNIADGQDKTFITYSSTNPGPKFNIPQSYLSFTFNSPTTLLCAKKYEVKLRVRMNANNGTAGNISIGGYPAEVLQPTITAHLYKQTPVSPSDSTIIDKTVSGPIFNNVFSDFTGSNLSEKFGENVDIPNWFSDGLELRIYLDLGWKYSKAERPLSINDFLGQVARIDISDVSLIIYEESDAPVVPTACTPDPANELEILLRYKRLNGAKREFSQVIKTDNILSQNGLTCQLWDLPNIIGNGVAGSLARWGSASFILDDIFGRGLDQITVALVGTYTGKGKPQLPSITTKGAANFKYACDAEIVIAEVVKGVLNDAVQSITLPNPVSGTWSLTVTMPNSGSETTAPLAYNITADQLRNALAALPSIGVGNLLVNGQGTVADPYTVEFGGVFGGQPISLMIANGDNLKGSASGTVQKINTGTKNERQVIKPVAGNLEPVVIEFGDVNPQKTLPIPYNASLNQRQAALEALSSIGTGNISVTGSTTDRDNQYAGTMNIDFIGSMAGANVSTIKCYKQDGTTPSTNYTVSVSWHGGTGTNDTQALSINATGGTYKLSFTIPAPYDYKVTTSDIAFNATAAQLKDAMVAAGTISDQPGSDLLRTTDVNVTLSSANVTNAFTIEFTGRYASLPVDLITVDSSKLSGSKISVLEVVEGNSKSDQQGMVIRRANSGFYKLEVIFPTTGLTPGIKGVTRRLRYNAPAGDVQRAINSILTDIFTDIPAPVTVLDRMDGVADPDITSRFIIKFNPVYGDVPNIIPDFRLTLKCDPVLLPVVPSGPYQYSPTPLDEVDDLSCQTGPLFTKSAPGGEETIIEPCSIRDSANVAKLYKYERDLISPNFKTSPANGASKTLTIRDAVLMKGLSPDKYTPYLRDRSKSSNLTEVDYSRKLEIGMSVVVVEKSLNTTGNLSRITQHLSTSKEILPSRYTLNPPVK